MPLSGLRPGITSLSRLNLWEVVVPNNPLKQSGMFSEEMLSLLMASHQLVSRLDLDEAVDRIVHEATGVVRAESCAVILRDPEFAECYFFAASGPHRRQLVETRFDATRGVAGRVLQSGQPAIVNDPKEDPDHYSGVDEETGGVTRTLVCVPLLADGKIIGVLEAVNSVDRKGFSDRDLHMLTLFANFAGSAIQNARVFGQNRLECQAFRSAAERGEFCTGESACMAKVWAMAARAAAAKCTVLITGESGTGKEVVASCIHKESERRDKPFICVNCAAIDENLLNSELFGHERGSFTGATERRIGRFEMAHSGTLFLDEISECSPATQARLLRVLQEQAFERIGGTATIRTDARIIAASNADIAACIRERSFREDLFHRLNVVNIHVPPLRERREDIPGLVTHFLHGFAAEMNREPVALTDEAMEVIGVYDWPGNVRELRNLVERLMVLHGSDTADRDDLLELLPQASPQIAAQADAAGPLGTAIEAGEPASLWDAEKTMIENALIAHGWNQTQAARSIGISRHHLRYRIKKFGLERGGAS